MSAPGDLYSDWDAAYVAGALGAEERREFERHLDGCAACSRAVAELAGLPGLLAAVPVEQAMLLGAAAEPVRPTDAGLERLLLAARRERARGRAVRSGVLVAVAAAAATLALLVPGWVDAPAGKPSESIALEQVVPSPLGADIRLTAEPWGTRIESTCRYADTDYGTDAQAYALYVTDVNGAASLVATWSAGPGSTVRPVGTTNLAQGDIRTVDIRSVMTGQVLLESDLPGGAEG